MTVEYGFEERVVDVALSDLVVFGCENGWIHVYDGSKRLWSKKLSSTYYRGPFTDVNVLSVDVGLGFVAVGTDFADGKVYLFDTEGRKLWERQLMSILGCWERPNDVYFVRIRDSLVVLSGFLVDNLDVFRLDGSPMMHLELDGVRTADIRGDFVVVGCKDGVYGINGGKPEPLVEVEAEEVLCDEDVVVVSSGKRVLVIGSRTKEIELESRVNCVHISDRGLVVGTRRGVFVLTKNLDLLSEYEIGDVVAVCENGALIRRSDSKFLLINKKFI